MATVMYTLSVLGLLGSLALFVVVVLEERARARREAARAAARAAREDVETQARRDPQGMAAPGRAKGR